MTHVVVASRAKLLEALRRIARARAPKRAPTCFPPLAWIQYADGELFQTATQIIASAVLSYRSCVSQRCCRPRTDNGPPTLRTDCGDDGGGDGPSKKRRRRDASGRSAASGTKGDFAQHKSELAERVGGFLAEGRARRVCISETRMFMPSLPPRT